MLDPVGRACTRLRVHRRGRWEFVERVCTCGEHQSRSIFFFSFTAKCSVSSPTCVRVWAGGDSAFFSMASLSFCLAYHRVRGGGNVVFVSVTGPVVTGPGMPLAKRIDPTNLRHPSTLQARRLTGDAILAFFCQGVLDIESQHLFRNGSYLHHPSMSFPSAPSRHTRNQNERLGITACSLCWSVMDRPC